MKGDESEVSLTASWRDRIKTELRSERVGKEQWSWMCHGPQQIQARSVSPVKYFGRSGETTVKHIKLPPINQGSTTNFPSATTLSPPASPTPAISTMRKSFVTGAKLEIFGTSDYCLRNTLEREHCSPQRPRALEASA